MKNFEIELKKLMEQLIKEKAYAELTIKIQDGEPIYLNVNRGIKLK